MAAQYLFDDPSITGGSARLYHSDTLGGVKTEISTVLLSTLNLDPATGKLYWAVATADETKFSWLTFYQTIGIEDVESGYVLLAPQVAADLCAVTITIHDVHDIPAEGVNVEVKGIKADPTVVGGALIGPHVQNFTTNASGVVVFNLVQNVEYIITSSAFPEQNVVPTTATLDIEGIISYN